MEQKKLDAKSQMKESEGSITPVLVRSSDRSFESARWSRSIILSIYISAIMNSINKTVNEMITIYYQDIHPPNINV